MNKYKEAFNYYVQFKVLTDSVFNEEKTKEITRKEMNFEFDKQTTHARAEQDKKDAIAKEELRQKELERNYFFIGFTLVVLFAIFIFRGYKQKQKTNIIITQQKSKVEEAMRIIEEKNKDILDSIRYAKRIQTSLLPTDKYIDRILNKTDKSTRA